MQAALQAARQLLSSGVLEWTAALSPDGKQTAFSLDGQHTAFSPDVKKVRMLRMLVSSEAKVEEGAPYPVAPVDFGG